MHQPPDPALDTSFGDIGRAADIDCADKTTFGPDNGNPGCQVIHDVGPGKCPLQAFQIPDIPAHAFDIKTVQGSRVIVMFPDQATNLPAFRQKQPYKVSTDMSGRTGYYREHPIPRKSQANVLNGQDPHQVIPHLAGRGNAINQAVRYVNKKLPRPPMPPGQGNTIT